jgi:hypothetical protein
MVKVLFRRPCHVPPCLINGKGGSTRDGAQARWPSPWGQRDGGRNDAAWGWESVGRSLAGSSRSAAAKPSQRPRAAACVWSRSLQGPPGPGPRSRRHGTGGGPGLRKAGRRRRTWRRRPGALPHGRRGRCLLARSGPPPLLVCHADHCWSAIIRPISLLPPSGLCLLLPSFSAAQAPSKELTRVRTEPFPVTTVAVCPHCSIYHLLLDSSIPLSFSPCWQLPAASQFVVFSSADAFHVSFATKLFTSVRARLTPVISASSPVPLRSGARMRFPRVSVVTVDQRDDS